MKNKIILIFLSIALLAIVFFVFKFYFASNGNVLNLDNIGTVGAEIEKDFAITPVIPVSKNEHGYEIKDELKNGINIQFASQTEEQKKAEEENKKELKIQFPKDYLKPIEIKLDQERVIAISDQNAKDYKSELLAKSVPLSDEQKTFFKKENLEDNFVVYKNNRKSIYYAYQKDGALGERKLKNWIVYDNYDKNHPEEKESYKIENAKIKLNESGEVEVFYFGQKEIQNEKAVAEVEPSLLERAQRTLEKEMGEDLLNSNQAPDFIIPKPYYLNNNGERIDLNWEVKSEENLISLNFSPKAGEYPLAMDPTLSFTAPGQTNGGSVITGETTNNQFGNSMISGDFNADGKIDLAVGARSYSTNTGRAYIFYNDGSIPTTASTADVIITGETTNNYFGHSMTSGDFNADGKIDLAVGAIGYSSYTGRVYIFYNDGSIPTTSATADVIVTGEATDNYFGQSIIGGDFNADNKIDLVVGANGANSAYIFYNDGSIPTTAMTADIKITGSVIENFGVFMTVGDFNFDGKNDLALTANSYSSSTGRVYIFYNDGSIPATSATADVIITGEATGNQFGRSVTSGDFNADGKTDLAVGANGYSTNTGRAYIFYNDSSIPTTAATADVIITGETTNNYFGVSMISGDFNADGKTDLAVGANGYSTNTGRVYIFYNDGSIPTTSATADVIIAGEATGQFGISIISGDFNADGKIDLVVGANSYSSSAGRIYVFYSQNGQVNNNFSVVGETSNNYFGTSMTSGDFNADGKIDLAIGAYGYNSNQGRVYILYNDNSIPTAASSADVIIAGEAANDLFGITMKNGDFNFDGKTDLAIGAYGYSSSTGRAYIFYNDGSIPTTAATADVIITGETTGNLLGSFMISGDFNFDGKTDLAIGAYGYSSSAGRAYIFYNDGSIPTTAATADVIITGEATSYFGISMTSGDFNADGKTDLAVGANRYSTYTGRAYIFYNDGSIPTTAATADVKITGETTNDYFSQSMTSGDFNADGKTDLAMGANKYLSASNTGRAYIFYNDGSIPTTAATADVKITGETTDNFFSWTMTSGDFNADGKTDLAVGAYGYSTNIGRAYIFYNDGSIPTAAATADVIITGEATGQFGISMTSGDFNADGKTDLAIGAYGYSTNTGRIYIYETRDNYAWQVQTQTSGLRIDPKIGQEIKIDGGMISDTFGYSMTSGDFNADGKTDLVVGASSYLANTGCVYIFYNDGSISNTATADVIIIGEAPGNYFGISLTGGDFNADGKTDLVMGASSYLTNTGRSYIFYNDGSIPATAATADVIITGEATSSSFGGSMISGDFNADSKTDLAVGANSYSSSAGRSYIFYNDGSIPTTAASADVIITGEATSQFGTSMASGDFNADGKTDLAVGANRYSTYTGRAYIFYNDGSIPTTAATADVIITGEATSNHLGYSMTSGDFNADGKKDLVVGAIGYSSLAGRAYIFYNDGSIPTTAATADVKITGEAANNYFGQSMVSGDFNADGKTDLAVAAHGYSTDTGRAYIFYNDGSIPTTAASADIMITGEASSNSFGVSMTSGDFNADGKNDLTVGASGYSSSTGRVYIYTFNDSQIVGETTNNKFGTLMTSGDFNADGKTDLAVCAESYLTSTGRVYIFYNQNGNISPVVSSADVIITGETTTNYFGGSMTNGDFNADGKTDLAVGARAYSSGTGRAYIFYNDGSIPTTAATADVIITGETTSNYFGGSMISGDFNADGKTDLVVGAYAYTSATGRTYIFHNDGSIPATAATADVIITGEAVDNYFSTSMIGGDFNADGKTDLAVGANGYSTNTGRAYIFHNDGSIPTTAATADVIITGEATSYFGISMTSGDFNADGKTDLAVGANRYSTYTGRAYIFYNDGSIPTAAATADVIITGETTNNYFGYSMSGGDYNVDGKIDLAVGAYAYSSYTGRAYIFYNNWTMPSLASQADSIITGESTSNYFATSIISGDFNTDSKTDLVVGANGYLTFTGKVYIIISEAKNESIVNELKQKGSVQIKGGTVKMR